MPQLDLAYTNELPTTSVYAVHKQAQSSLNALGRLHNLSGKRTSMLEHEHVGDRLPPSPRTSPDPSYLQDVLRLPAGKTEEQMDAELRDEAKLLGVDIDALARHEKRAQSTGALSSGLPRRSEESIVSKASQSTVFSDASREHSHVNSRGWYRTSASIKDYGAFLARGAANGRQSVSFSPPSTPSQSTTSLPLSSPESSPRRHFRRIRGLGMLRLSRGESSTSLNDICPHCPRDTSSQRRAMHKLPCGHKLCTQALRNTVKAATDSNQGGMPSCCGIPIPGKLIEHVMTQAEQNALLEKLEQWDEASSIAASLISERRRSSKLPDLGHVSPISRTASDELKVDALAQQDLDTIMERSDYKLLRQDQADQRDRFLAWVQKRRVELEAYHELSSRAFELRHQAAMEDLLDAHAAAMSDAEDRQVQAEADMRQAQSREKRDNTTALKHMEAYCAGIYSTGELHGRIITEQDLTELEKTRRARDQMDAKHESAINVLRGEQSRRMKLRAQRQEREVQELRKAQGKDVLELARVCAQEVHQAEDCAAGKKHSIRLRWQIQNSMVVKRYELESGVVVQGRLPSLEWPSDYSVEGGIAPRPANLERVESGKTGISTGFALRGTA